MNIRITYYLQAEKKQKNSRMLVTREIIELDIFSKMKKYTAKRATEKKQQNKQTEK